MIMTTDQPPGAWSLICLYSGDEDPQIAADMTAIEAVIDIFTARYAKLTERSLTRRLAQAICSFEKLQWMFLAEPTIDEQLGGSKPEYYWMLRDASNSTDATQAEVQKLAAWRLAQMDKLEFFFQLFDGMSKTRRRSLLNARSMRPYREWLVQRFMLPVAAPTPAARTAAAVTTAHSAQLTSQLNAALGGASAVVWKDGTQQHVSLPGIAALTTSPIEQEWQSAATTLPTLYDGLKDQAFVELTTALAARTAEAGLLGCGVEALRCASDTLSTGTLDDLIQVVMSPGSLDVAHRYYALKAALMGGQLPFARRRATYGTLKKYSWLEAVELIQTFFERISPTLLVEFNHALANGYIDAQPREGKTSRTACWWRPGLQPMLAVNFIGDINNISQIVHEFAGHFMAALAVSKVRDGLSYNTKIPLAETHGVSWQLLVPVVLADKLGSDDQANLIAMMAGLETIMTTIYLQGVATAFEQKLYTTFTQGSLTLDQLEALFTDYMHQMFGDGVATDELTKLNWVMWPQLRQGFYNYSYCMAGMFAVVLREQYETDPTSTVQRIDRLMAAGSKNTLTNIFGEVDITLNTDLWQQCIRAIAAQLDKAFALARQLGLIPAV